MRRKGCLTSTDDESLQLDGREVGLVFHEVFLEVRVGVDRHKPRLVGEHLEVYACNVLR